MNIDLRFYWALLLRRAPVMTLLVLVCAGLGVITALKLPNTYATSARLLVEAPQIPERMVASTVQTDAVEQLDIIQQRLMTRANMIDIANRFNVLEDLRATDPDRVVAQMQAATSIRRSAGRGQATLLTIGFTARDPRIAADVVNEYVTLILADASSTRTEQVTRTLQFFEQEVARLNNDLDAQSAAITAFKGENADALPEEQGYRLGRQALLQERLGRVERDISATEAQQRDIVRIFENTGQVRAETAVRRTPEEAQLASARAELETALAVYSETNPRVVQLRVLIARLEQVVATQTASAPDAPDTEQVSPQEALFNATLSEIETRLTTLRAEDAATQAELDALQDAIARSAANGIVLANLERDYASIQSRYDAAVGNLNQSRMSERIETTAQGQRISVIENANVPRNPAGPNRPRIAAMGLAVGLAAAAGFFALLEMLNRTVRRPAELTARFNIIPLATIPYMESRRERLLRRGGLVAAMLVVLAGVPLGLWYIDNNYQPLDILVQRILNRINLG